MRQAATRIALLGIMAAGLPACAVNTGVEAPGQAEAAPLPPVPMVCNAASAQQHVGKDATQMVGEAIIRDSGARTLRWGPPNAAWTMDYRQDRVNVRYDATMTIIDITCG